MKQSDFERGWQEAADTLAHWREFGYRSLVVCNRQMKQDAQAQLHALGKLQKSDLVEKQVAYLQGYLLSLDYL